jgi:SAM-dependent MidA family methyltransferase
MNENIEVTVEPSLPAIPEVIDVNAQIGWEEFVEKFQPVINHLDSNASCDNYMYETYGKEDSFVRKVTKDCPERVWTIIDDGEDLVLASGWHYVNRIGYLITQAALPKGKYVVVID